ncbi:MAG: photosystem II S4 domain protein [Synechococcaceae cyanobacterium]|nr:photosystem II S4 domain protein [Synechococcaceae cyanobacterium]
MRELQKLLSDRPRAAELAPVVQAAERALRTWTPVWTGFLDPSLREEAETLLAPLSELQLRSDGGFRGAERRRLCLSRPEAIAADDGQAGGGSAPAPDGGTAASQAEPLAGLELAGNFLFDPATAAECRALLERLGARPQELGDVWLRGDRGAQAVVLASLAQRLDGREDQLRSVPVLLEARPLHELRPPEPPPCRRLSTVEASLRLDALASAGFGLSRSRLAGLIRQGAVRVNWQPVSSPSRLLAEGDRVQLEGRGELRLLAVQPTLRGRLRVEMERGGG